MVDGIGGTVKKTHLVSYQIKEWSIQTETSEKVSANLYYFEKVKVIYLTLRPPRHRGRDFCTIMIRHVYQLQCLIAYILKNSKF